MLTDFYLFSAAILNRVTVFSPLGRWSLVAADGENRPIDADNR